MSWEKLWLVLKREYVTNFRRPSFLFTAFGVPAISLVAMFLIIQFTTNRETNLESFQRVGYLDRAGVVVYGAPNPNSYQPLFEPGERVDAARLDALEESAQQQLRDKTLDAYFVISDSYVLTGQVDVYALKKVPQALQENIESFMQGQIAQSAINSGVRIAVPAQRLQNPADLVIRDVKTDSELTDAELAGRILLPFIFVFIYFMATSTTAQFLMSGVVEEKENRLMEILATSLRPVELLWGKMLGLGALSLTQIAIWTAAGVAIGSLNDDAGQFLSGARFQAGDIVLLLALFVINFVLFAAIMMGIGAAVTAEAESRQIAGFLTFIAVAPLVLSVSFFSNPNGPLPLFFSFFPLTAAVGLIMRIGLTAVPTWQIALSVAIQLLAALAVMWLAAKVFRLGMLMYGKPLTPRALWAALREGRNVLTTAQTELAEPGGSSHKRSLFGR